MSDGKPCLDCGKDPRGTGGARGLCKSCYYKRRLRGTLDEVPKLTHSFEEHLATVVPDENGCWPWPAVGEGGYGYAGANGTAHVRSYEHHIGPVPDGFDVGHVCHDRDLECPGGVTCRHRRCVNPDHLAPQTRSENLRLKRKQQVCKRGHDLTPENVYVIPQTGGRQCRRCVRLLKAEKRERAERQAEIAAQEFVRPAPGMPDPRPATTSPIAEPADTA